MSILDKLTYIQNKNRYIMMDGGYLDIEPFSDYDHPKIKSAPDHIFSILNRSDCELEKLKNRLLPPNAKTKGTAREELSVELTRVVTDRKKLLEYLMKHFVSLPYSTIDSKFIHPISPNNTFIDDSVVIVTPKHNALHVNVITDVRPEIFVFNYETFKLEYIKDKTVQDKILDNVLHNPEDFSVNKKRINIPKIVNNFGRIKGIFKYLESDSNKKYLKIKAMVKYIYDKDNHSFAEFNKVLYSFIFVNRYNLILDLLNCIHDIECHEKTVRDSSVKEVVLKIWDMIKSMDIPSIYYLGPEIKNSKDPETVYKVAAQSNELFVYSPHILKVLAPHLVSLTHSFNYFSTFAYDDHLDVSPIKDHPLLICMRFITEISKMMIIWREAEMEYEKIHPNSPIKLTTEFTNAYFIRTIIFAKNIMVNKVEQLNSLE